MRRWLLIAGLLTCVTGTATAQEQGTCVSGPSPAPTGVEPLYIGNRAPLKASPFVKLPVGAIRAHGWLGRYLELQRDGLTGQLGQISDWLDREDNAWLSTGGSHGWEEVPYWLRGYGNLAYLLDDEEMIAETELWVRAILNSQREDGFFGPGDPDAEKGTDIWPNMLALFIVQSYHEHTGDPAVIEFMTRYFRWAESCPEEKFLRTYWENSRAGDMLYSCFWLYNRTGDDFLLKVAQKIHENTADWSQQSSLPNWHNVNIAQCFREPAIWWMLSGDESHRNAAYNNFWLVRACYGQVPGGMFGSDENCRMGYIDPRQGVETCGMAEQMSSDTMLVRITGDPSWADNCEDVAFNTYPAAFMPDFRSLRYITCPNQVVSDSRNHSPGIQNAGPFMMMNPFSSRCCQHNHTHGWPYYVENLWMATSDRGIAAILYAASEVTAEVADGTKVTISGETHYPFEEQIAMRISTPEDVCFPLYLRVPAWCDGMSVQINGSDVNCENGPPEPVSYFRISRTWKDGDLVTVKLPMKLKLRTWQQNRNSVSIDYGPLTFSLKIDERYERCSSTQTAMGDSHWQKDADESQWPSYEIYADSAWNYGLNVGDDADAFLETITIQRREWPHDQFPWTPDATPITMTTIGTEIPQWTIDQYGLCAPIPPEHTITTGPSKTIELIPMGAARLRISAFPVVRHTSR
ncbi:MAG: glycoside hydrolase family 127 protein [Planctomycetia bacterium]|nr:glycoside hydrolase family 127 protein [Planctomycetia bacterium]